MSSPRGRRPRPVPRIKSRDLEDIVEDALESPFNALESVFDSLGGLFDGNDMEPDGTRRLDMDIAKIKTELRNMKHNTKKGRKTQVSANGGATFSIGSTGKKHKHRMKLKDEDGNLIEVTFNNPADLSIRTEGDLDTELMEEVKRHISQQLKDKDPINVLHTEETYKIEEPAPQEYLHTGFWSRTWRGEKKDPIDVTPESKVSVSGPSMLNRKYNVEIDGVTVYMRRVEEIMETYYQRNELDVIIRKWTDDEKAIMLKVFEGLKDLGCIEEHHTAIQDLL